VTAQVECSSESLLISDRIFLRVSDKVALGSDDLQWIVYLSRRKVPSPVDAPLVLGRGGEWRPVSFVRSTKAILMRLLGQITCHEAQVALAGYPDTFDAWKATVSVGPGRPKRANRRKAPRLA
jgi:hypothetical protein